MKQIALMLSSFLIILTISGCTSKVEYVMVPQRCTIQAVEEPIIDTTFNDNIFNATKQCTHNYLSMKEYAEKLKAASMVCQ